MSSDYMSELVERYHSLYAQHLNCSRPCSYEPECIISESSDAFPYDLDVATQIDNPGDDAVTSFIASRVLLERKWCDSGADLALAIAMKLI